MIHYSVWNITILHFCHEFVIKVFPPLTLLPVQLPSPMRIFVLGCLSDKMGHLGHGDHDDFTVQSLGNLWVCFQKLVFFIISSNIIIGKSRKDKTKILKKIFGIFFIFLTIFFSKRRSLCCKKKGHKREKKIWYF